jgi:hypothetical protein
MNEPKPIMKKELTTRAYNVLVKTGLYSNSAMLTAKAVIAYFNNGSIAKDCGAHTKNELIQWAEKIVQNKTSEEMAYPQLKKSGDIAIQEGGLTKREWFAGMALQGLVSRDVSSPAEEWASVSFKLADAMLKEGANGQA